MCIRDSGYTEEDLLFNSRISYEQITHPDDRQHVRDTIQEAVRNNRRFDIEYRIVRADGSIRQGMGTRYQYFT